MKTIRTKVYKFNELSEQAKEKAIEWYLNDVDQSFAFDDTVEDAEQIGLKIIALDDHRQNEGEFLLSANEVAQNIFNEHGEECETYKTAQSFMEEWQPVFSKYMETEEGETELIDIETNFLNSLLEDYRIMYNKNEEYQHSREYAIDNIEANEYDFTKDGNFFHKS